MPPDRHFIDDSLRALEENLQFLKTLADRPAEDFLLSREASYSAAYALMICIEATAGVAAHLVATTTKSSPKGMASTFDALLSEGVISSPELAASLAKMSRFRNLIVHRYWTVDYGLVHEILLNHLGDFRDFAAEIQGYLDTKGL